MDGRRRVWGGVRGPIACFAGLRFTAGPLEGAVNAGLNVPLGGGPLGRVAGKKASYTGPPYIKTTKTHLYNVKNPCGIDKRDENWVIGI